MREMPLYTTKMETRLYEYERIQTVGRPKTIDINSKEKVNDPLVKARLNKELKCTTNLIIHHRHERQLSIYKKDIHQLWNQIFKQTPVYNPRLIIGNQNADNLSKELVQRRPQTSVQ